MVKANFSIDSKGYYDEINTYLSEQWRGSTTYSIWSRQMPIDGAPANVVEIVQAYADRLAEADLPRLFINVEPGAIINRGAARILQVLAESNRREDLGK